MKVELRPHTGRNAAKRRTEDLGQDRIFVDGFCVGYVQRKPGAPICLVDPEPSDALKAAVETAVAKEHGSPAGPINSPPPLPEEVLDEYLDDEDLDDE